MAYLSSDESGLMTGSIIDFDQQVLGAGNAIAEPPDAVVVAGDVNSTLACALAAATALFAGRWLDALAPSNLPLANW